MPNVIGAKNLRVIGAPDADPAALLPRLVTRLRKHLRLAGRNRVTARAGCSGRLLRTSRPAGRRS
jgi:hypothetical protein